jgi:diacylglycerol kinase (ATP)
LRVAPAAKINDGWLNLSFVRKLTAMEVLGLLPRLLNDGTLPESYLQQRRARRVVLRADRPCFFQGDGEIFGPAPVEIEVLPGALKVLAPAAQAR